jgi:GT2 family glycosyltransferase
MSARTARVERAATRTASARARAAAPAGGWLGHAAWLSDEALLIAGWLSDRVPDRMTAALGDVPATEVRVCRLGSGDDASGSPAVIVALFRAPHRALGDAREVAVGAGSLAMEVELGDLRTLVSEGLAWHLPEVRARTLEFLLDATAGCAGPALSRSLHGCREALRERLPQRDIDPLADRAMYIENLAGLGDRAFYIEGWSWNFGPPLARMTAVSPEGSRIDLLPTVYRYPRGDITALLEGAGRSSAEDAGFLCHFEIPSPTALTDGWVVELEDVRGAGIECAAPPVSRDSAGALSMLLGDLALERLPDETLRVAHLRPAISRLLRQKEARVRVDRVVQLGEPPASPEASIIIPLYGRIDLVEHQLAQFVHDPEVRAAELIYVLDSPEYAEALEPQAVELFRLYGVPFRLVMLNENGGFALANNFGAQHARGRALVLMNSDVLPRSPGWLGRMLAFFDATPDAGAVAPKLIYEDDSIQHAGMYFAKRPGAALWTNEHHFKGMDRSLPAANVSRRVDAVTAACVMVSADAYRRLGGLRSIFVRGDYEDSDLCLRLREEGLDTWYLADVELYHLEAQSYPGQLRGQAVAYNCWLHTAMWRATLEEIAGESAW